MTRERRSIPPVPALAHESSPQTALVGFSLTLTASQESECESRALALARTQVQRAPAYLGERLVHMGQIATLAASDATRLVGLDLDGEPLRADEIHGLDALIAYARQRHEQYKQSRATRRTTTTASSSTTGAPAAAPPTRAAQRKQVERVQRKLMRALRKRYKNDPAQLSAAQQAMAAHTQAGTLSASAQILALCRQGTNLAWLAALPHGEGAAVDALEQLTRAFSRSVHSNDGGTLRDALDARNRAWTVAHHAVERVRSAGRYLVEDDPTRKGDYLQYDSVRARRPKAAKKKPAAPAPAPAAPDATKRDG
jgi:hypothetical protein